MIVRSISCEILIFFIISPQRAQHVSLTFLSHNNVEEIKELCNTQK